MGSNQMHSDPDQLLLDAEALVGNRQRETLPGEYVLASFHTLLDNRDISQAEFVHLSAQAALVQTTLDQSEDGNNAVFRPGNLWEGLGPQQGDKLRSGYALVNLVRMFAPFAGMQLPIVDRLDAGGQFSRSDIGAVMHILAAGTKEEMWRRICASIDPETRLSPYVHLQRFAVLNVPERYIVRSPKMFGEIGVVVNGVISNPDTVLCQSRINALYAGGGLFRIEEIIESRGICRILEIGAGCGQLARALMDIFPGEIEYVVCDLPSSLLYSVIYAGHFADASTVVTRETLDIEPIYGRPGCTFAPNYLIDRVVNERFPIDVAINTMSMPEMSEDQVNLYCSIIASNTVDDGFFYEANNVVHQNHVNCKEIFSKYFAHRHSVKEGALSLGGETHDIWSNAPYDVPRPIIAKLDKDILGDSADTIMFESLGRAAWGNRTVPNFDRYQMMIRAAQIMQGSGVPTDIISRYLGPVSQ